MQYKANTPEDYINQVPEERKEALKNLRNIIKKSLPKGFEEGIQYGMIGYYVPHSIYPDGYHCTPSEPLPFIRFKNVDEIPLDLIAELCTKMTVDEWITVYEKALKK